MEGHIARNCPNQGSREHSQGEINLIVQELDVLAAEKRKHEGGTQEGQTKRQEVIVEVPTIQAALKSDAKGKARAVLSKETIAQQPQIVVSQAGFGSGASEPMGVTSGGVCSKGEKPSSSLAKLRMHQEQDPGFDIN